MVPYFKVRLWLENLEDRRLLAVFTVTNTDDAGAGSLRQAILDANNNPGLDTIAFDIGGGGAQSIRPASPLPAITDRVMIDGTTQPGFDGSPLIELSGMDAIGANGLTLQAGSSTIRGLVINSFDEDGILVTTRGGNKIVGNFIGTDLTGQVALGNRSIGVHINGPDTSLNIIGGSTSMDRNLISGNLGIGIGIEQSSTNQIQGNLIGTDITGNVALRNFIGIASVGSNNLVGGTSAGARNIVSGNGFGEIFLAQNSAHNTIAGNYIGTNEEGTASLGSRFGVGIFFLGSDIGNPEWNTIGGTTPGSGNLISGEAANIAFQLGASYNVIQGNYIGTDASGTVSLSGSGGIQLFRGSDHNQIGGTLAGAGNLISGNSLGLFVESSENLIQGNLIGTDATGTTALGNEFGGVSITGNDNTIGGTTRGASNVVAYNGRNGISVTTGTGNAILRNSLFGNAAHGIELTNGGNRMEPAPVLTAVTSANGSTTIEGTLNSLPSSLFTLEFFVNTQCHPSGEGERFVTAITLPTDEDGTAEFSFTFRGELPDGQVLTATATDPDGNTSAFSACQDINRTGSPGVLGVNDEALAVALSKSLSPARRLWLANRDRLFIPRDQERASPWTPRESDRPLEPIVRPPVSRRTEPGYDWLSGWLWEVEPGLELSTPSRADTL